MADFAENIEAKQLIDNSLAFFGAITASVTHELNNIIAIISQTGGLLDDLLIGTRQGREIPIERLERIAKSMDLQTNRGREIIKRLNTFAHSTDQPICEYDICSTVGNLISLAQRLVKLKMADLETKIPDEPIMVTGNPFLVQQVFFLTLQLALDTVQENDIINLIISKIDNGVEVNFEGIRSPDKSDFDLSYIEWLSNNIRVTIKLIDKGKRKTFKFVIPYRQ